MIIIGSLFFIFGFITWLNSVLIPFLRQACQLTDFQAFFVTFAFYFSYFIMAIPSSAILKKTGFAKGMSVGLAVMALGSLIFIPAALSRSFPLFLVGLFIQAARDSRYFKQHPTLTLRFLVLLKVLPSASALWEYVTKWLG